jgi:D-beta-D-heptose 7-phosphate kinase/D-beta-D-heptose 1-phosphate adenosyltransferase
MRKTRYEEIVREFAGKPFIVVGDIMVDRYITGQVNRISPESPTMVVEVETERRVPGGAANVVNNLVALEARVTLVGVIGDDHHGGHLTADLAGRGVDTSGIIIDRSRPTTVKERIIAQNRQLLRVDYEQTRAVDAGVVESLEEAVRRALPAADAVVVSDYCKGVLTPEFAAWLVGFCRSAGKLITVNPKPVSASRIRGADVISVNQVGAEAMAGIRFTDDRILEKHGARLAREMDARAFVVTRGARGLTFWTRSRDAEAGEMMRHVAAHPVEVNDVAGAGDTAISALTLGLACGADILEAATVANHAAACVVRKVGVATVSPEELLADWTDEDSDASP